MMQLGQLRHGREGGRKGEGRRGWKMCFGVCMYVSVCVTGRTKMTAVVRVAPMIRIEAQQKQKTVCS